MNIQKELFKLQDIEYKAFSAKLMPTVDPNLVIGIRTPILRDYAKKIFGTTEAEKFIKKLPHKYYEENNLHAFLIEQIKDFDAAISETEIFLPYIDNWATCDSFMPKVFKKNTNKLLEYIKNWISSDKVYTVRYAIKCLMALYLDDKFSAEYPDMVSKVISEEYYINMMIAWYFATALAKRYDEILPYITEKKLSKWIHNKTIQKAIESYRISPEQKEFLRALKIT